MGSRQLLTGFLMSGDSPPSTQGRQQQDDRRGKKKSLEVVHLVQLIAAKVEFISFFIKYPAAKIVSCRFTRVLNSKSYSFISSVEYSTFR